VLRIVLGSVSVLLDVVLLHQESTPNIPWCRGIASLSVLSSIQGYSGGGFQGGISSHFISSHIGGLFSIIITLLGGDYFLL
jgi:hypothetical protein